MKVLDTPLDRPASKKLAKNLPVPPVEGKTYIAGPMTLFKEQDWNRKAFAHMAWLLRQHGILTVSPHELHDADENVPWDAYLRADLRALATCTRVVLLPRWDESKGATLEHTVAQALGMEIVYPKHFIEWLASFSG